MDTDATEPTPSPRAPELDYTTSEQVDLIFAALASAQGAIGNAEKSRTNPAFKSKYATLADCLDACRPQLAANGLCLIQPVRTDYNDGVIVTTLLGHSSGQWLQCRLTMPVPGFTAHTIGSAITYGRRYGLSAVVGIAPDDDDGNDAVGDGNARQSPRASQQPQISDAERDRAKRALKALVAARKAAGMPDLTNAQAMADLMGPDFSVKDPKSAADFCDCVNFELERIEMSARGPA